jgi:hypothetical protein
VLAGDQSRDPLNRHIGPELAVVTATPVSEKRPVDLNEAPGSHAMKPLRRNLPKSTTADLRLIVAIGEEVAISKGFDRLRGIVPPNPVPQRK